MVNRIIRAVTVALILISIIIVQPGCSLVNSFISEISKNTSAANQESGETPDQGNETGLSEHNIAPVAVFEIYQQNSDGYYLQAGNPVYFTAENSFDGDGDELIYRWDISGTGGTTGQSFEYTFEETGIYEVTLYVSDGNLETLLKKKVEVVEIDDSVIITGEHSLTVEVQYTFTNNGPGDIEELFCLMEVPRTYLPYQVILDRRSNYREGDQLIQDEFNVVAHFNLGGLQQGKIKTAYINCDVLMYEYEFASPSGESGYRFGDDDLSKYTQSEYFIDSDSNVIRSAARSAIGDEDNPRLKAEKLYYLVVDAMEYDYSSLESGKLSFNHASNILQEGWGVCTDYSILYAALCRAAGIPAIIVQGIPVFSILNEPGRELSYGHAWVEIKLPEYGWIPIDITSEEGFMGYNYFLNLQTYKGSGIFYKSLEIDGEEYYPNGVYFTWMGDREPSVTQDISYRVKGLSVEDLDVYKESDFLDNVGFILSEYNAAMNHVNNAHGEEWIFNDPAEIAIEETLLERLKELSSSLENVPAAPAFSSDRDELERISKEIIDTKQNQINCMKASDYDCNISYYNIFSRLINSLFEYYNSLVDSYNSKY
jgi:transglutaminase-like putative cysteine protease